MNKLRILIFQLLLPILAGGLSYLLSQNTFAGYESLKLPPLSPPGLVFPIVWTILYLLMGLATYLIVTNHESFRQEKKTKESKEQTNDAQDEACTKEGSLILYGIQLLLNVLYSPVFFRFQSYFGGFLILVVLWFFVYKTYSCYRELSSLAGLLFLPYLLWCTFAIYLNFGIILLN